MNSGDYVIEVHISMLNLCQDRCCALLLPNHELTLPDSAVSIMFCTVALYLLCCCRAATRSSALVTSRELNTVGLMDLSLVSTFIVLLSVYLYSAFVCT
ncbi:hypothetical protein NEOLEDRAFT_216394 [Neolentinus lepideus HHB14362 ss-1]|uniref:Uncharacterized protein n=1 Tax=Neolentinus lepideus HHB14362 ss-1 TaxID=1314782 RepID=A0A165MCH3_9AGAM|nr:hypothetical protein NEOLEDRAFT_216394 [Neolentinus lepideus HHB14362 ss-1]